MSSSGGSMFENQSDGHTVVIDVWLKNAGHHENVELEITFAEPNCMSAKLSIAGESDKTLTTLAEPPREPRKLSFNESGESENIQIGLLLPALLIRLIALL